MVTTPSIVRVVKQSLELTNSADEDLHIISYPWNGTADVGNYVMSSSVIALPGGANVGALPQVSVYKVTAGTNLSLASVPDQGLSYPNSMQAGCGRLIGMGIEIINTTAPIQRSGSIHCWRSQGLEDHTDNVQFTSGGVLVRAGQARRLGPPPISLTQAMLTPGTRSWAAEEGCYMVVPFNNLNNPPLYPTSVQPIMTTGVAAPMQVGLPNSGQAVLTGSFVAATPLVRLTPVNTVGCILTGTGTSFKGTLNVVYYYEEFPDVASDILTLATPSCENDPIALKMYSAVLNTLPVAVPSNWNTAGDWWWDVVSAIKDHAKDFGALLGGKQGELVGSAASTVAGWTRDRYMTSPGTGGSSIPPTRRQQNNNNNRQQATIVAAGGQRKKRNRKKKNKNKPQEVVLKNMTIGELLSGKQ